MPASPRRGRPPEADRRAISLVALELFELRGLDAVTMDEIAQAAKVSRRTLFRLFPSKAALVWEGLDEVLVGMTATASTRKSASLRQAIFTLFSERLRSLDDPTSAEIARRRLRIVARAPALLSHPTLAQLETQIARLVARTRRRSSQPPELVARSLFGVGLAVLFWWAESDGQVTPLVALGSALSALGEVGGRPGRQRRRSGASG